METTNGPLNRKLRMALVGGGQGAFIGRVHATAAVLDNRTQLVAGALSSDGRLRSALAFPWRLEAAIFGRRRKFTRVHRNVGRKIRQSGFHDAGVYHGGAHLVTRAASRGE